MPASSNNHLTAGMTTAGMTTEGYEVRVEALNLYATEADRSYDYERDGDLTVNCAAAHRGGTVAGLILVELGIDGNEMHRVRLDFGVGETHPDAYRLRRSGDEVRALTDAIDAMTALRNELARVQR